MRPGAGSSSWTPRWKRRRRRWMAEADRRQAAHDALLAWCSELGSGTCEQFKRAVAYLRLGGPTRVARGLSVLGHVEFDWRGRRFSGAAAARTPLPGKAGR